MQSIASVSTPVMLSAQHSSQPAKLGAKFGLPARPVRKQSVVSAKKKMTVEAKSSFIENVQKAVVTGAMIPALLLSQPAFADDLGLNMKDIMSTPAAATAAPAGVDADAAARKAAAAELQKELNATIGAGKTVNKPTQNFATAEAPKVEAPKLTKAEKVEQKKVEKQAKKDKPRPASLENGVLGNPLLVAMLGLFLPTLLAGAAQFVTIGRLGTEAADEFRGN